MELSRGIVGCMTEEDRQSSKSFLADGTVRSPDL